MHDTHAHTHTKVIIVLRVRGEWRPSIAWTNKRSAVCFVRHQPLNSILTLYYYGRRRRATFRPSIQSHTHTRRRFSLLFVYFSDSHRLSRHYYYYYYSITIDTTTTTTTTTSRIRLPMLPWYTRAYHWRDGEEASPTTMIVRFIHR